MRKLLVLLLLLFLPLTALGENNAQIVTFSTPTERVKLRERPDDSARVMGQYYGGQPVEILEDGKQWELVSIGGRTGYMMKKFLTDLTEDAQLPVATIRYVGEGGTLPLYDQAGGTGRVIAQMPRGKVQVLGTVSQDWLHVRYEAADGTALIGFASALSITWPGEAGQSQVTTKNNEKLPMRAEPSKSAAELGNFYPGVVVDLLIEDSATKGWAHVRVGSSVGYMQTAYLQAVVEETPLPTGHPQEGGCAYYLTLEDEQLAGTLFAAASFTVVAEQQDRCLVRLGGEDGDEADWVWVDQADITYGYVTRTTEEPSPSPAA